MIELENRPLTLSYQPADGCTVLLCAFWLIPWTTVTWGLYGLLIVQERTPLAVLCFVPFAAVELAVILIALRSLFYVEDLLVTPLYIQHDRRLGLRFYRRRLTLSDLQNIDLSESGERKPENSGVVLTGHHRKIVFGRGAPSTLLVAWALKLRTNAEQTIQRKLGAAPILEAALAKALSVDQPAPTSRDPGTNADIVAPSSEPRTIRWKILPTLLLVCLGLAAIELAFHFLIGANAMPGRALRAFYLFDMRGDHKGINGPWTLTDKIFPAVLGGYLIRRWIRDLRRTEAFTVACTISLSMQCMEFVYPIVGHYWAWWLPTDPASLAWHFLTQCGINAALCWFVLRPPK